jgi:hypothetical protein
MNEKIIKKTPNEVISERDRVFEINKLIEKALTFYCGKYKKKFNFKIDFSEVLIVPHPFTENHDVFSGIRFKYDNRSYSIKLFERIEETDVVEEMIKESDWNNDELVSSAINQVKKTIH